ncbi:hypothetical protein SLA2020_427900 [Shorea laevis]
MRKDLRRTWRLSQSIRRGVLSPRQLHLVEWGQVRGWLLEPKNSNDHLKIVHQPPLSIGHNRARGTKHQPYATNATRCIGECAGQAQELALSVDSLETLARTTRLKV